jgi:5-methyltetrahydropteroyltriglutamate--homocysteine methyltransferase
MTLPTEPIGSIPRALELIRAIGADGDGTDPKLEPLYEAAIRDTIECFEATGSPVISDGEQRKFHNFWTYSVHGMPNASPEGFRIPFTGGHTRRMPRLTTGPFRYMRYADEHLDLALRIAHVPVKQAVISPSVLSLMYPGEGIRGYLRQQFIDDLLREHETEVRRCLKKGAYKVQIDFTEGRLAIKIDPSGSLLSSFIDLNNLALARFSAEERTRIGAHTCPGADRDSTHSTGVDYAELLPSAHDGAAALAAFGGFAPDIVLLDIGMPGRNGYEVARQIRQARLGVVVKLIAITGWGQEADKQRAFAAGFDHHLTKPVDTRQQQQLIEP